MLAVNLIMSWFPVAGWAESSAISPSDIEYSEPFEIIGFSMAPNPMEEWTRIIINTQGETSISYQLLDSMGTILREGQMDDDGNLIHREDLVSGIYFLRILGSKSILGTQKLIIR